MSPEEENKKLKAFLDWLFEEIFEGSPEGCDIQDKAEEMGLLKLRKVNPDENDYGAEELYFAYWWPEKEGSGS